MQEIAKTAIIAGKHGGTVATCLSAAYCNVNGIYAYTAMYTEAGVVSYAANV